MNKRGFTTEGKIGGIALVLVAVVVMLFIFQGPAKAANLEFTSQTQVKIALDKCTFDAEQAYSKGISFSDTDDDGHPNTCDICLGVDQGANMEDGQNDLDDDLDGMPNDCDKDAFNSNEFACLDYRVWDKQNNKWLKACCTKLAGDNNFNISPNLICKKVT
ncbi:hypothetical protein H8D83_01430 [Candidatus Woesearchaeota archaeon]|nr:hypothetical protein [Candidatus Woesearchaeota archaeon]MBL7050819.1 hypothetical protein [Candidatus Woesearchaeota archaeon]